MGDTAPHDAAASPLSERSALASLNALHQLVDENTSKNLKLISCPRCPCKILRPNVGTLTEKRFQLPGIKKSTSASGGPEREILTKFWLVTGMLSFENIGFTNTVDNTKYLICADCEVGPIGFHETKDSDKFYLATDRVNYK